MPRECLYRPQLLLCALTHTHTQTRTLHIFFFFFWEEARGSFQEEDFIRIALCCTVSLSDSSFLFSFPLSHSCLIWPSVVILKALSFSWFLLFFAHAHYSKQSCISLSGLNVLTACMCPHREEVVAAPVLLRTLMEDRKTCRCLKTSYTTPERRVKTQNRLFLWSKEKNAAQTIIRN